MTGRGGGNGRRMSPEEFRRMVDDVRKRHDISEVVGKWTKLKPAGKELVGLCLSHSERSPSMRVNDAKGHVFCFGCGYTADIFRVVMDQLGCGFSEALRWLGAADLATIDPAERIRQRQEQEAERAAEIADAQALWRRCVDPAGTPAERYIREARGISAPIPPSVRFGFLPTGKRGRWGRNRPAMVCGVFDRGGEVVGIQRVFVRSDGLGKAAISHPKQSLGRIKGACLRLGPVRPSIIVCEGPEDGLSIAQDLPECSVWPTLGTGLMPHVDYPEEVREIVIAGQNDGAGKAAVQAAAEALLLRDYRIRTMFPDPAFKDWNDQLRGVSQ